MIWRLISFVCRSTESLMFFEKLRYVERKMMMLRMTIILILEERIENLMGRSLFLFLMATEFPRGLIIILFKRMAEVVRVGIANLMGNVDNFQLRIT